jgi:hypothetical protein
MYAVLKCSAVPVAVLTLAAFTHSSSPPATSLDPISTIIEAYRTHTIVALDDDHGEERCSAFRVSLVRDPRFIETVNDIVVEFGNSKYQAVVEAFVSGDAVNEQALRAIWQDTTTPRAVWDRPIYEEFFRVVRAVNGGRPRERQLRVLLGDPPIDWQHVRSAEDLRAWSNGRSIFPAELVAREVIAKHRRALIIYGALHLMRQNLQGENLIERLDRHAPGTTFVVIGHPFANLAALGIDGRSWQSPALVLTSGTSQIRGASPPRTPYAPVPRREFDTSSSLANQIDAILYLGAPSDRRTSRLTAALCRDPAYRAMRISRITLTGDDKAREQFDRECAIEK